MKLLIPCSAAFTALIAASAAATLSQPDDQGSKGVQITTAKASPETTFKKAVRLQAGGQAIVNEDPGYASPTWFDFTGDGREDLVVGQFEGGMMKAYPRAEDGSFGEGAWVFAGKQPAEVPDVW